MNRFFYGIWNDLKRNKYFNILIFLEILILIILCGVMIGFAKTDNNYVKLYDKKNDDLVFVSFASRVDPTDYLGKDGFENLAMAKIKYCKEGVVTFVNKKATQLFEVPYSGTWFSGNEDGEYKEALVSKKLKDKYVIENKYELKDTYDKVTKIKIIGYLGKDNTAILMQGKYDQLYGEADFMICDSSNIEINENMRCVSDEKLIEFYSDYDEIYALNYKVSYEDYKERTQTDRYFTIYILTIVFAITTACIVCNSIFKVERDIKRNMLKFIVGNSNNNIVLAEVVKCSAIFLIPFFIDFVVALFINIIMQKLSVATILSWENFFISAGIILALYATSTVFGLVRTIRAKPLDELRKE